MGSIPTVSTISKNTYSFGYECFLFILQYEVEPERVSALIKGAGGTFLAESGDGGYRMQSIGSPSHKYAKQTIDPHRLHQKKTDALYQSIGLFQRNKSHAGFVKYAVPCEILLRNVKCAAAHKGFISFHLMRQHQISQFAQQIISHLPQGKYFTHFKSLKDK